MLQTILLYSVTSHRNKKTRIFDILSILICPRAADVISEYKKVCRSESGRQMVAMCWCLLGVENNDAWDAATALSAFQRFLFLAVVDVRFFAPNLLP